MPGIDNEIVGIVDQDNRLTDRLLRSVMRSGNLLHRAAYILVISNKGELFLQKRASGKDLFPGYWDLAAGGVVLADETYDQAARRELYEELGIDKTNLAFRFMHYYADRFTKVWGAVFTCRHEGPFVFQDHEIESGRFLNIPAILALHAHGPVTPDSLEILKRFESFCMGTA